MGACPEAKLLIQPLGPTLQPPRGPCTVNKPSFSQPHTPFQLRTYGCPSLMATRERAGCFLPPTDSSPLQSGVFTIVPLKQPSPRSPVTTSPPPNLAIYFSKGIRSCRSPSQKQALPARPTAALPTCLLLSMPPHLCHFSVSLTSCSARPLLPRRRLRVNGFLRCL